MNTNLKRTLSATGTLALAGLVASPLSAQTLDGAQLVQERCISCHTRQADGTLSRIGEQRKTPEGWMTTINRMQHQRGLRLSADERRAIIKYLADSQGLAPSETASKRYLLEQTPNITDDTPGQYAEMCARCHSGARFALQRRSETEWNRLVHFHMGQYPTLEFHALSRDRAWFELAVNDVVPQLARDFPLQTQAWTDWQQAEKHSPAGRWVVAGYLPGKGEYSAVLTLQAKGDDRFALLLTGQFADGSVLEGKGAAVLYTGYELRAGLTVNGQKMRQVLSLSENGQELSGRMFPKGATEMGGEISAARSQAAAVLAISPAYIREGETRTVTLTGSQLDDRRIRLDGGLKLEKVVSRNATQLVLKLSAMEGATPGMRTIQAGAAKTRIALYSTLARVGVVPANSIARIGGNGGKQPKVNAAYRAVGYALGADGKAGTEDDLALGYMPASWSLKPLTEAAAHDRDLDYAGTIDARGVFTPGDAGLNPQRKMSTNNVGHLAVVGTVKTAQQDMQGQASLLVTVQDFVKSALQ